VELRQDYQKKDPIMGSFSNWRLGENALSSQIFASILTNLSQFWEGRRYLLKVHPKYPATEYRHRARNNDYPTSPQTFQITSQ